MINRGMFIYIDNIFVSFDIIIWLKIKIIVFVFLFREYDGDNIIIIMKYGILMYYCIYIVYII